MEKATRPAWSPLLVHLLPLVAACGGDPAGPDGGFEDLGPGAGSDPMQPPPVIQNLAVRLPTEPYDPADPPSHMGAFAFYDDVLGFPEEAKHCKLLFLEFASRHDGCGNDHPSPTGIPNFEFYTGPNLGLLSQVISPLDGTVLRVAASSPDSAVTIIPHQGPVWEVELDHLMEIVVQEGETVHAGRVIADRAGRWGPFFEQPDKPVGRTEFQITKVTFDDQGYETDRWISYCPPDPRFWSDGALRQNYIDRLTWVLDGWNQFVGVEVYDVSDMPSSVCLNDVAYP